MTGPEHYEHAENWLFKAQHQDARGGSETAESCAAIAQVHATLALAAATALDPVASPSCAEWLRLAGEQGARP